MAVADEKCGLWYLRILINFISFEGDVIYARKIQAWLVYAAMSLTDKVIKYGEFCISCNLTSSSLLSIINISITSAEIHNPLILTIYLSSNRQKNDLIKYKAVIVIPLGDIYMWGYYTTYNIIIVNSTLDK